MESLCCLSLLPFGRFGIGNVPFFFFFFLKRFCKATYVTLRGAIKLMVAVIRGASSAGRHFSQMISTYLRSEIARATSLSSGNMMYVVAGLCCFNKKTNKLILPTPVSALLSTRNCTVYSQDVFVFFDGRAVGRSPYCYIDQICTACI